MIVFLCTHNPRADYLAETLEALRLQTLPTEEWDLVIIDNASLEPLSGRLDLSWHPRASIVREEKLGTFHARWHALRVARDAGVDLLMFVDDDNLLAPDYLEQGMAVAREHPELGAWGGQLLPRYEQAPPSWIAPYRSYLAIFPLEAPLIGRKLESYDVVPPTAGGWVRRQVFMAYLSVLETQEERQELGPKGDRRIGGEDMDLMLTAFDVGLGLGRFPQLRLTHIIPGNRLTPGYISKLMAGNVLGVAILEYLRFGRIPPAVRGGLLRLWRTARLPAHLRTIAFAEWGAQRRARRLITTWAASPRS